MLMESRPIYLETWRQKLGVWLEGGITKEQVETFRGDGYVYNLDCGDGSISVFLCQNPLNFNEMQFISFIFQ